MTACPDPAHPQAVTEDDFLGGRLRLRQPETGYRIGADSILLAAAIPAVAGERVLDVGCGTGAVALALGRRVPGLVLDGLELQPELAGLAAGNARRNGIELRLVRGDLSAAPAELARNSYDHVVTNPPYLEEAQGTMPPDPSRARAFVTRHMDLRQWIAQCLKFVRPRGYLHLVQRVDRLTDVLAALDGRAGDITVYPLWPREGTSARRFILHARKGGRGPMRLLPGLVLHNDGGYTPAAEAVLRHGAGLPQGI